MLHTALGSQDTSTPPWPFIFFGQTILIAQTRGWRMAMPILVTDTYSRCGWTRTSQFCRIGPKPCLTQNVQGWGMVGILLNLCEDCSSVSPISDKNTNYKSHAAYISIIPRTKPCNSTCVHFGSHRPRVGRIRAR